MKKSALISLCCLSAALILAGCAGNAKKAEAEAQAEQARLDSIATAEANKEKKVMDKLAQLPEEPVFDIITNHGTIRIKLYADTPKHRENFAKLALTGFYDGLLFHRVINGFMIQGGDPLTINPNNADQFGTGGPGYTIPAEFVAAHKHKKGALAAARRGDAANPMKESSGSQFYLVQDADACSQLDGDYTVFGETIDGIKVIDNIASVEVDRRSRPVQDVKIIQIKLVEE